MATINADTEGKVLIPTNRSDYPYLIKTTAENWRGDTDVIYLVVKANGTLTGDGWYTSELAKYCPDAEL